MKTSYFKLVTFIKCLLIRLKGGKIQLGKNVLIHPSVSLSTGKSGKLVIGSDCIVLKGVIIAAYEGSIRLGSNVSINPYTILYGHGGLRIGSNVRIAAHSVLIPAEHEFEKADTEIFKQGIKTKGIIIGDDVWIGTGAKVLDGSDIAAGCVIGANAVLKGKTEAHGIYVGCPAKKIKTRKE